MSKPVVPFTTNYLRGGGVLKLAERSGSGASSSVYGMRDLGDSLSVALSREVDNQDIIEGRTGSFQLARRDKSSEVNTVTVEIRDMTIKNFALFFGLDTESRSVAATPVTDEQLLRPFPGASYKIGRSASFPEGIRSVTSVDALTISGGTWASTTAYAVGDVVIVAGSPAQAHICTVAGTSDGSEPTWASAGGTVVDGTVTWRHLGPEDLTVDVDYSVDLTNGAEVGIVAAGTFGATTLSRVPSGYYLTLLLDYTPVAESYMRLKALDTDKTYYLAFNGQAEKGQPMNFVAPFCNAIGSGESQWISQGDPQTFTIEFSAQKVTDEPAIQMDQATFSQF